MFDVGVFALIFTIFLFCFIIIYVLLNYFVRGDRSVCVVVLGDVGHSPRMQYHSISLTQEGFTVDLVGYSGSRPHQSVCENSKIHLHYIKQPPEFIYRLPRLMTYAIKCIWQFLNLGITLLLVKKSRYILMQNPPSLPSLVVCLTVCVLRRSKLVTDWHNYGYTILALALGSEHPLVKFSEWYEGYFGKFAFANLCVTEAMKDDLAEKWHIRAETMYDKSANIFQEVSLQQKHEIFTKLKDQYSIFRNKSDKETVFTKTNDSSQIVRQKDSPALLVSSTSWTEDEDFGLLLEALEIYDMSANTEAGLPDVICIITGKGPLKKHYSNLIAQTSLSHVRICLPWLEAEDYPVVLGSADLGVCLHKSSSGMDLPMKIVDMFGCHVPVCAFKYNCIEELVQHKKNGLLFETAEDLSTNLKDLFSKFHSTNNNLCNMKSHLRQNWKVTWHDAWKQHVLPIFLPGYHKVKKD